MTKKELEALRPGDVIRDRGGTLYQVVETGDVIRAVRLQEVTRPGEWTLVESAAPPADILGFALGLAPTERDK